jgi:CPA2 family monovalent cation:H+ antiporter-2
MVMMGVLVAEDLFVVLILSLVTSIGSSDLSLLPSLGWIVFKIGLFMTGTLVIGILIVPRIIDRVNFVQRDEVIILIALGMCFGLSFLSNALGLSLAIGAFLMGVLIATAKSTSRVVSLTSPIKDMFAAMFFVSMGALIDVSQLKYF